MSLINQMLRDIEKRRRDHSVIDVDEARAGGVRVPAGKHRGGSGATILKALAVVVPLAFAGLAFYWTSLPARESPPGAAEPAQPPAAGGESSIQFVPAPLPPAAENETGGKDREIAAALLEMSFAPRNDGFRFTVEFSSLPDFTVEQTSGSSLQLLLKGVEEIADGATLPDALPLLDGLQIHERTGATKVILTTADVARFGHFVLPGDRYYGTRLVVDVAPRDSTKPWDEIRADQSPLPKQESVAGGPAEAPAEVPTPEPTNSATERDKASPARPKASRAATPDSDSLYRRALQAMEEGDRQSARRDLSKIMRRNPDHHAARETLGVLLYRAGRLGEAESLFAEGLTMAPRHAPFRKALARLRVEKGEVYGAVEMLAVDSAPPLEDDPEYFSLLAGCYQRVGEHLAAAEVYRQLVEAHPGAGLWWMGMGIALEDAGRSGRAQGAYQRAMAGDGLSEKLRQFVAKRLQRLESG